MKPFTNALKKNIEQTFTYSHAKNRHNYEGRAESYDSLSFFTNLLSIKNPFQILMELERVAFVRAEKIILAHDIPCTPKQKKQARIYLEVTERMVNEKSDVVAMFQEDLQGTGIVVYEKPFYLTTSETIQMHDIISGMLKQQKAHNIVYEHILSNQIKTSKEQMNAIKTCLSKQVSVLIGGAGTGKSFVTAEIIKQLQANNKKVEVLAPTHKAREALQEKIGTTSTVRTIHSFVHKPEKCDAIVIDESGMLSTPLLLKLLNHHTTEQLIFVGDKNQLPPIDYGRPFERIQKVFSTTELKENKRSESSDIIGLGREILGLPFNANMQMKNIISVSTSAEAHEQGAEVVLSHMNNTVKQINEERRVKNGIRSISPFYSVGDKIIATTNDSGRFYNGQLFEITHPDRAVNQKTNKPIVFRSAKDLERNFQLAYGLTIHKSQGSEWDTVAYQPSAYDTRNLAYVAVTRAKKRLIIIGNDIKSEYKPDKEWRQLIE